MILTNLLQTQTIKRGVCPPLLDQPIGFCLSALFTQSCYGDDAHCPGLYYIMPCTERKLRSPFQN